MRETVTVYGQVTKKQEKPLIVKEWQVILVMMHQITHTTSITSNVNLVILAFTYIYIYIYVCITYSHY